LDDHEFDAFEEKWIDVVDESITNETVRRTAEHTLSLVWRPGAEKTLTGASGRAAGFTGDSRTTSWRKFGPQSLRIAALQAKGTPKIDTFFKSVSECETGAQKDDVQTQNHEDALMSVMTWDECMSKLEQSKSASASNRAYCFEICPCANDSPSFCTFLSIYESI